MKIYVHNKNRNVVGTQVKAARLKGKTVITQHDLSARLAIMGINIDRTAISKIEAGERLVTDYELYALSKALGVTVDWLYDTDFRNKIAEEG